MVAKQFGKYDFSDSIGNSNAAPIIVMRDGGKCVLRTGGVARWDDNRRNFIKTHNWAFKCSRYLHGRFRACGGPERLC